MDRPLPRLRDLSRPLRVAATGIVLVLALGEVAALMHVEGHAGKKDGDPELTLLDVEALYHGVDKPAPLLIALDEPRHRDQWAKDLKSEERALLERWLRGEALPGAADPIAAGYDNPPPGAAEDALLPADVLAERCARCHSRSAADADAAARALPLDRWPDRVKDVAYSKHHDPLTLEILAVSTHTHAPAMAGLAVLAAAFVLATRLPRPVRHGAVLLLSLGLLLDLASMWLGRLHPLIARYGVAAGGALFAAALLFCLAAALIDLWWPRRVT